MMDTPTILTYARAIIAHVDAHDALRANDFGLAHSAYTMREQALEQIAEMTGVVRADAFARVVLMARDALARRDA